MSIIKNNRYIFAVVIPLLVLLLIASFFMALGLGAMKIDLTDTYRIVLYKFFGFSFSGIDDLLNSAVYNIIWKIRFPRVVLGLVVGAGLSVCGVVMQATVQNPLAEPYILGISSGAALGATFAIMAGASASTFFNTGSVPLMAFLSAMAATAAVLALSSMGGNLTSSKLVLSGTMVNFLCTALSNFIISLFGNDTGVMSVKFWTMGSIARASWDSIALPAFTVGICTLFFLTQCRAMNAMLLGDEAALTLDINLTLYRKIYMAVTALLTGILVASCGVIGFTGLVVPHVSRAIVGSDNRRLIPIAFLCGAIFMIWADVIARILIPNSELSIGIITSLVGAPFFAYMLIRRNYRFG